jgi:hypothetical protein
VVRAFLASAGTIVLCWGCGGSTSDGEPTSGGSLAGAGGVAGSAGAMAGGGGSASGTAGANSDDPRLMPFAEGRSWTFEFSAAEGSEPAPCPNPTSMVSGTGETPAGPGWRYSPACVPGTYLMAQNNDDIMAYQEGTITGIEYMKEPVEEGASWFMYVWREAGQVMVPAGAFDDCWRREAIADSNQYVVFCRGVGLVESRSSSPNLRTLLVSKSF